MYKLVLEKAEEPEIKLPTSTGSWKKQERSRKTSISALLTMPKPLTMWITINCGKFWKRWEYQAIWPAPEKFVFRSRNNRTEHGATYWFQVRNRVHQGSILSPCLFNFYAECIIWNPERWCCESAALNMPASLENSAVATGLEKVSFHSNSKERQRQRMLKLPHNCTHLTC